MNRRDCLYTMGAALLAAPLAAKAQSAGKVHRVGHLASGSAVSVHFFNAFKEGLRETGWIEGQNVTIESRYAEGKLDRFPVLAAELVRLKVDVIATVTTGGPWQRRMPRVSSPLS